jgi:hypothetical protein
MNEITICWNGNGNGGAGKKVTKPYSINCNPFSRAIASPLSNENPATASFFFPSVRYARNMGIYSIL